MNKKGFEFSFAWLFAILVGAFIIFLAIYAATSLVRTQQYKGYTEIAKEISIIFNPLETGLASGKSTSATLNAETRLYNKCSDEGSFGSEKFSLSQKSGFLKKWPEAGGEITLYSKYVFSDEVEQGSRLYFFSKPFSMPFKVSEIIFLSSEEYCFVSPPDFIKDEVSNLELRNVKIENCTGKEIKVCFNERCNISVYPACEGYLCDSEYDYGSINKNGKTFYYTGSLIYAGIFSSPEVYRCNFERLMIRLQQIALLYSDEVNFIVMRGCGNAMLTGLARLMQAAKLAQDESSSDSLSLTNIVNLKQAANDLDRLNSAQGGCKIYE